MLNGIRMADTEKHLAPINKLAWLVLKCFIRMKREKPCLKLIDFPLTTMASSVKPLCCQHMQRVAHRRCRIPIQNKRVGAGLLKTVRVSTNKKLIAMANQDSEAKNPKIKDIEDALRTELLPSGVISAFAGENIPAGWDICDGKEVSKNDSKYAHLFLAIGTVWGGSGTPTFNLPDLRGVFLRGVSGDSNNDPDKTLRTPPRPGSPGNPGNQGNRVGSFQKDDFKSHGHSLTDNGHSHGYLDSTQGGPNTYGDGDERGVNGMAPRRTDPSASNLTVNSNGGTETRPLNAYVIYIIKL